MTDRDPSTDPRGIDVPAVTAWLDEHLDDGRAPYRFDLVAAGGSNLTFRLTDADGRLWALRRPPVGSALATAHDMDREWRIMSALDRRHTTPVPACVARCDDEAVTGAPFYVMEFVDGLILRDRADADRLDAEAARVATESLVEVQVGFHTLDLHEVGLAELGRHDGYVTRQLKRWRGQVERVDLRELPLMVELHERLAAHIPPERATPALAHGDYRFDNTVLGSDHHVTAVLDWELCTTGDPIADFAWSIQYWADPGDQLTFLTDPPTVAGHFPRRDEVIELYRQRSGFDLGDLDYYTVFSWWKQACIVEGAYARRLAGASGGMGSVQDPEQIGRRVDTMLEYAHELARGVV